MLLNVLLSNPSAIDCSSDKSQRMYYDIKTYKLLSVAESNDLSRNSQYMEESRHKCTPIISQNLRCTERATGEPRVDEGILYVYTHET